MNRAVYLTLGLLVMTLGCRTSLMLTDQQKESIGNEVRLTSQQFWQVYSRPVTSETLGKIMGFIDDKGDKYWPTDPALAVFNVNIYKTRSDLEKIWMEMLALRSSTNVTILENYFSVLSKDQVLEVNTGDYTITGKDGSIVGPFKMVNTIIWINKNGVWKMEHFHESWASEKE